MPGLVDVGQDYATNPGLSVTALAEFLRDIDFQPAWRSRSEIDADYYDSNQYDQKTLQLMEERGIPPIVVNLIAPTINLILGMEAKVRQDWVVRPDDDKDTDFAMAMSQEIQMAERGSFADRACSDAYASQVKAGLGWVHVYRQKTNPFAFPYAAESVHRREIWWDWHDEDPLLRNARWLVRRKWYDLDVLRGQFPAHRDLLDQVCAGWTLFEDRMQLDLAHPLYQDWMAQRDFHWGIDQWRNLDRKRLQLYEVWYRVYNRTALLVIPSDGRIMELQRDNPLHAEIVRRGLGEIKISTVPKVRRSYWVGPHRLVDEPTPMPHEDFPYVPFWGYREDRTAVPYGHIRAMRPMQDEVNARRARMLWQLSARRLIGIEQAVKDKKAVELEAARPDAAIWLNGTAMGSKTIEQVLRLDDNQGLNVQQMAAYQDAKVTLQDVANTFKEQLGKSGAADSGIAISQLIEQGTMALAELNENYTFARTAVGNQLYALVKAEIGDRERTVTVKRGLGINKKVKLNEVKHDADANIKYRSNDVALTRAKVVLDDVPANATFRQFQFRELTNLVKGLPTPELQAAILDMVILASDVPHKEEIAKRVKSALGIENGDVEQMSPEEQKAYQAKMQTQEFLGKVKEAMVLLAKERADLENKQLDAENELTEAKVDLTAAQARLAEAQTAVAKTTVAQGEFDIEHTAVETEKLRQTPVVDDSKPVPGADPSRMPMQDVA